MSLRVKYLLIGGGIASSTAAQAIRERDVKGPILLVAQEPIRPYHRPPLSKDYLGGDRDRQQLFTQSPDWYDLHQVMLYTGRRAVGIDVARQAVFLDNGQDISYEKLLIAIGGTSRGLHIPGAGLPNVFSLRTVDDADRLANAIEQALAEGRRHPRGRGVATILGGGLLAVELSAALTRMGMRVHLVSAGGWPWHKIAGRSTGQFLARYLEDRDIQILTGQRARALEGDGRVQRVVLDEQVIETDLAIAAIGMHINRDLLRGTSIAAERAILTDDHARTNVPDVYAAGDCSAIFDPRFGKHRLFDHWDHARATGWLAGGNMAGGDEAFDSVGMFASDIFDLSMTAWGEPRLVDRRLIRGNPNPDAPDFIEIGVAADGRIAQVMRIQRTRDEQAILPELVRQRVRIDGREEQLKDPAVRLESFIE